MLPAPHARNMMVFSRVSSKGVYYNGRTIYQKKKWELREDVQYAKESPVTPVSLSIFRGVKNYSHAHQLFRRFSKTYVQD